MRPFKEEKILFAMSLEECHGNDWESNPNSGETHLASRMVKGFATGAKQENLFNLIKSLKIELLLMRWGKFAWI